MKNKLLILTLAIIVFVAGLNTSINASNFHIIRKGDNINTIAELYDISPNDIILHNRQIINTNFFKANEHVNLPNVYNNTYGVLYKTSVKNSPETTLVSNFNYQDTDFQISDKENNLLTLINEERAKYDRLPLVYDETLSMIAQNESVDILNKDVLKLQNSKELLKKLTFYNVRYNYAGLLSTMGQKDEAEVLDILKDSAHTDFVINPDYQRIGLYIIELNDALYTSIYFATL